MRVLYTLLGAVLVAGGAFLAALVNAETPQAPQPVQMGESTAPVADLDALAMRVLNAIRTESFADVYDCFIPYRQTAEGLAREEETYRFEGGDLAWEEVRSGIEGKRGTDPLNKLKLQALKDYRALELRQWVAHEIGSFAKPEQIRFTDGLPKTRSGKIMRRLLREIVTNHTVAGDITTLEDLNVLTTLSAQHDDES